MVKALLVVGILFRFAMRDHIGDVIRENPAAASSVATSSAVALVISSGVTFGGVAAAGSAVANNPGYALDAVTGTQIPFTTDANGKASTSSVIRARSSCGCSA